jgi:hypothetical protein
MCENIVDFKCIPEDNKICKKTFALIHLRIREIWEDYRRTEKPLARHQPRYST